MNRLNENTAVIIIFALFILSIGSVMSTALIPLTFAQKNTDSVDSNEKLNYTHHKTMVNGFNMHYVIGGKGDPVVLLHGWPETWYE